MLRAGIFAPTAGALVGACVYAGAFDVLGAALGFAAAGGALRRATGVDAVLPAALFCTALRIALVPSWDAPSALFAAAVFAVPPLASLAALRRLAYGPGAWRALGVHAGCAAGPALAPWAALLGLFLLVGPAYLALDGDGRASHAARSLLLRGHALTWIPLVVTAAWVGALVGLSRRAAPGCATTRAAGS